MYQNKFPYELELFNNYLIVRYKPQKGKAVFIDSTESRPAKTRSAVDKNSRLKSRAPIASKGNGFIGEYPSRFIQSIKNRNNLNKSGKFRPK